MHIVLWGQITLGTIVTLYALMNLFFMPHRPISVAEMNVVYICFVALSVSVIIDRACTLWLLNRKRHRMTSDSVRRLFLKDHHG